MEHNNAPHNQPDGHRRRAKRKPGGQPGNRNARKRGLFARTLTPEQRNALRAARRAQRLPDVINVLRIRLAAQLTNPHANLDQVIRVNRLLMRVLRFEYQQRAARERGI